MDNSTCLNALSALSQPTRLDAFRLLMTHEPEGLLAGEIARRLGIPHNTMSAHLAILARAGLVTCRKQSRTMTYRAELRSIGELVTYLLRDCCGGRPQLCASLINDLAPCCEKKGSTCG